MIVQVKLFAIAKDIVGAESIELELPDQSKVAQLRESLVAKHAELSSILGHAMIAINTAYANDDTLLKSNDEVAIIPPVSGG